MGFSLRDLWNMKRIYERYHLLVKKLRHCFAVLPWGHNWLLINSTRKHTVRSANGSFFLFPHPF